MKKPFLSEPPEQSLARAFADHVLSWAREAGNINALTADILKESAWRVSMAVSSGDSCLLLDTMREGRKEWDTDTVREKLLGSKVVSTPESPGNSPLVLDEGNRLYLHRYFDYEKTLAQCLLKRSSPRAIDAKTLRPLLDSLFPHAKGEKSTDWQKMAAALALMQSLLIISGGPGTGKTTTVASLLACILETDPDNRIILAAPTGKAAKRMLDSISERIGLFPLHMQHAIPKEAFTIHRLLGMSSDLAHVRFHAGNPLPADTLIVDEASMLDLAMASKLFAALPHDARVILLGDKDQLAAVEAGSVFSELSSSFTFSARCRQDLLALTGHRISQSELPTPDENENDASLQDCVVWLMKNYRFSEESGIGRLATDIRDRQIEEALGFLRSGTDPLVQWLDMDDAAVVSGFGKTVLDQFDNYSDAVKTDPYNVRLVFDIFNRSRILCAVREGTFGVNAVNRLLSNAMSPMQSGKSGRSGWFIGQPVMVKKNDYVLKLFNGDVGIVLPDAAGNPAVFFPNEDGTFREISPSRIGEHETSFAMTVHQSQGSEFDSVLLLLPAEPSRVLCRELVYTGVTRARNKITLASRLHILEESLRHDSQRLSGLKQRIAEIRTCRDQGQ